MSAFLNFLLIYFSLSYYFIYIICPRWQTMGSRASLQLKRIGELLDFGLKEFSSQQNYCTGSVVLAVPEITTWQI